MVFTIWLCVACTPAEDSEWDMTLIQPTPLWVDDELMINAGVDWTPSPAVIEALDHGVGVPIRVTTRVSRHHRWFATMDRDRNHRFEVRYLPLVRSYQLSEIKTGQVDAYPRMGMLVDALRRQRDWHTGLTRSEAAERDWQVEIRVELDRTRLPSPMRLPVWFDDQWRSASPWHGWRVEQGQVDEP